ncbi:MAG: hypothetical protein DLM55_12340 [Acidimicrobiales bacterium]|nr:MAG: hypothetical protein DLM55_12340 [Acidimicrobiales bacterium]
MVEVLAEREVLPLYGQVIVQDVGTVDIPDWETGKERTVASEHAVLIATRPDHLGKVRIQVLRGNAHNLGFRVFHGELSVSSGRLTVGSVLAGQVVEVGAGCLGHVLVEIFVDPADLPERVTVVLENNLAGREPA